jgi:hypothetical protein
MFLLTTSTNEKVFSQEMTEASEQLIENNAMLSDGNGQDINETEGTDDERKYNINSINEIELLGFNILTPQQINSFIIYRKRIGSFISLFELQAVPGWDIETIKAVINKFKIKNGAETIKPFPKILRDGKNLILFRTGGKSFDTLVNGVMKGRNNMVNQYKQLIKYSLDVPESIKCGITIEKDAGEKNIVDHMSGFLNFSSKKILKDIFLGDYTVNIGQ